MNSPWITFIWFSALHVYYATSNWFLSASLLCTFVKNRRLLNIRLQCFLFTIGKFTSILKSTINRCHTRSSFYDTSWLTFILFLFYRMFIELIDFTLLNVFIFIWWWGWWSFILVLRLWLRFLSFRLSIRLTKWTFIYLVRTFTYRYFTLLLLLFSFLIFNIEICYTINQILSWTTFCHICILINTGIYIVLTYSMRRSCLKL